MHGKILGPPDGDVVPFVVSAELRDVINTFLPPEAVRGDVDFRVAVTRAGVVCLEYVFGDGFGMLERVLSVKVGDGLVLPE